MAKTRLQPGFTLVELLAAITLVSVLLSFGVATMNSVVRDSHYKRDVAEIDGLIRATTSECMARGLSGIIVTGKLDDDNDSTDTDKTIRGFYVDKNGNRVQTARYELIKSSFTRSGKAPTPWLRSVDSGQATTFTDNQAVVTASGMIADAGVIFVSYGDYEAAIEILANGSADTFHYQGTVDGEDVWTR